MAEAATIYTGSVSYLPTKNVIEVEALLLSGEIKPGMFLCIPLNRSLDMTLLIQEVRVGDGGSITLVLQGGEDREETEFLAAFNFGDETLKMTEEGEPAGFRIK